MADGFDFAVVPGIRSHLINIAGREMASWVRWQGATMANTLDGSLTEEQRSQMIQIALAPRLPVFGRATSLFVGRRSTRDIFL